MSTATSIEWTDRTWNPVRGCELVSPGCSNCYAMKQAHRFSGAGKPYDGLTKLGARGPLWTGRARPVPEMLAEPLRWRKPQRVFVNSMSDLFREDVPDEFIDRVWAVMLLTPRHTYQVLTKRAERMATYLNAPDRYERVLRAAVEFRYERPELMRIPISDPQRFPARNVWLGISVEDQRRADERIPHLLRVPAAVRFLSCEPLLGPVDLFKVAGRRDALRGWNPDVGPEGANTPAIDWVIVGGESGPGARPFDLAWARSIVGQCRAAGVACFVKQLGAVPRPSSGVIGLWRLKSKKGGDPAEWPEDLRVREWPTTERTST